jgi:hypothetical protein
MEALHLACAFDLKASERSNAEIERLIPPSGTSSPTFG